MGGDKTNEPRPERCPLSQKSQKVPPKNAVLPPGKNSGIVLATAGAIIGPKGEDPNTSGNRVKTTIPKPARLIGRLFLSIAHRGNPCFHRNNRTIKIPALIIIYILKTKRAYEKLHKPF